MTMISTKYRFKRCLGAGMLQTVIVNTFACFVAEIEGRFHSVVKVVFAFHAPNNTLIILSVK